MSEKYTEHSVVLLKREIERLAKQTHDLLELKETYAREADKVEYELASKLANRNKIISSYDDIFVPYFNRLQNEEQRLLNSIRTLSKENKSISAINSTVRSELNSIEVKKPKYTFVEQVTAKLRKELNSLGSAISEKDEQKNIAKREVEENSKKLSILKDEIKRLAPTLKELQISIKAGNDKNGKLGKEYLHLREQINSIKRREHNIHTMEKRLLPKYRKMYSGKLCKRCGNLI